MDDESEEKENERKWGLGEREDSMMPFTVAIVAILVHSCHDR